MTKKFISLLLLLFILAITGGYSNVVAYTNNYVPPRMQPNTILISNNFIKTNDSTNDIIITSSKLNNLDSDSENFNDQKQINPYVSISYGINDDTTETGRRIQYYTYSIDKKKLDLQCGIPFLAQYGTGVVSLVNQKVYYSGRSGKNPNDSITEYDIKTGETHSLESENATYNDIAMIDNNTLLVTAISKENGCNWPATFDLKNKTFTYLYNSNNINNSLYSTRAGRINYNYVYNKFVDVFVNENEFYSSEFNSNKVAIDYNIALVSPNLLLNTENIFTKKTKIADDIYMATQISDNSILLQVIDDIDGKRLFYLVNLINKQIEEIDCPFKNATYITDCITLDQGKSYFVLGGFQNGKEGQENGLFYYDTNTKQAEPILMNNDSIQGHVINFTVVGSGL